jgi:hypothetical protein
MLANFLGRFWLRLPENTTETFRRRFLRTWFDYVKSVPKEAEHRSKLCILDVESYWRLRRSTCAAQTTMGLGELDMDIPDDEVWEHPIIRQLEGLAVDLIHIPNVNVAPFHSIYSR